MRNTQTKWIGGSLSAAVAGIVLSGCGGGTGTQDTTVTTPSTTQIETKTETKMASDAPAALTAFFPDAQFSKRSVPMDANAAKHMSEMAGVKFTGDEGDWEVYEAVQDGRRLGMAVQTHSPLPDGKDMHIGFAVDNTFKITKAVAIEAPDAAKLTTFLGQVVGKSHSATFKIGKDLKAPQDVSTAVAQTAADAVHKGIVILEEFFNPSHGAGDNHKAVDKKSVGNATKAADGHEGHGHGPDDGHGH